MNASQIGIVVHELSLLIDIYDENSCDMALSRSTRAKAAHRCVALTLARNLFIYRQNAMSRAGQPDARNV